MRVMDPVFAMEESYFLDGGSRLDDDDLGSLDSVSEWRSVAYLPTNVPDVGHTSVQRIWREAGIKPHLVKTFKISNDPEFEEKVTDVVGLYMNPPDKALVLCVDEKSQIQALDRSQPGLPLKPGRAATMTHDYKRHGTTTLFGALDLKCGFVVGECLPRHRAK